MAKAPAWRAAVDPDPCPLPVFGAQLCLGAATWSCPRAASVGRFSLVGSRFAAWGCAVWLAL